MPPGGEKRTQHLTNEEKRGQSEQKKNQGAATELGGRPGERRISEAAGGMFEKKKVKKSKPS